MKEQAYVHKKGGCIIRVTQTNSLYVAFTNSEYLYEEFEKWCKQRYKDYIWRRYKNTWEEAQADLDDFAKEMDLIPYQLKVSFFKN
jgi:hypothetical protein